MKIPFIKVKQKGEIFFVTKLNINFLRNHVNFHFRDPYLEYQSGRSVEKVQDYLERIRKKGLKLKSSPEGIQRRLQIHRINDIRKYIESTSSNFFPNSILLSVDVTKIKDFENQYLEYEEKDMGYFDLPDNIKFTVIDGQHRLAGLFLSNKKAIGDFELVATLLFNISLSTAAKLFTDINGKQKPVNRSLIYDIYGEVEEIELKEIKKFHTIAQKFYTDEKSPLFRQIKMLGIGKGAISQAFFIDYTIEAIKKIGIDKKSTQEIYNELFYYFRAFQRVFSKDWPVPKNFRTYDELDKYADKVLRGRKSQLVKTNGFGAILKLFPDVYERCGGSFYSYFDMISKLKGKISWVQDPENPQGTGKQFQNYLVNKMRQELFK